MYQNYSPKFREVWRKIADESPPSLLEDSPWTLTSMCDKLGEGERKIHQISLEDLNSKPIFKLGNNPYYSYTTGPIHIGEVPAPFAETIINNLQDTQIHSCFKNTRAEINLIRLIEDFGEEMRNGRFLGGEEGCLPPFKLATFPLELAKDSVRERGTLRKLYAEMGLPDDEFYPRVIRNVYLDAYVLNFLRGFNLSDLAIASSSQALFLCIDFCDKYDGVNFGLKEAYVAALTDGFSLYGGGRYAVIMNELIMTAAFISYKNHITKFCGRKAAPCRR